MTTGHPAASAGAHLRVIIAAGKFHGVIEATTPIGCFSTRIRFPGLRMIDDVAVDALRLFGEPLDERRRVGDLAARLGQRLALLARHQHREVVLIRHQQLEPPAQQPGAVLRRAGAPADSTPRRRPRSRPGSPPCPRRGRCRRPRASRGCRPRWRRRSVRPSSRRSRSTARGTGWGRPGKSSCWHPWSVGLLTCASAGDGKPISEGWRRAARRRRSGRCLRWRSPRRDLPRAWRDRRGRGSTAGVLRRC